MSKLLDVLYGIVGIYVVLFVGWFLITFGLMFISGGEVGLCKQPVYRNIETVVPARKLSCWLFEPENNK